MFDSVVYFLILKEIVLFKSKLWSEKDLCYLRVLDKKMYVLDKEYMKIIFRVKSYVMNFNRN